MSTILALIDKITDISKDQEKNKDYVNFYVEPNAGAFHLPVKLRLSSNLTRSKIVYFTRLRLQVAVINQEATQMIDNYVEHIRWK